MKKWSEIKKTLMKIMPPIIVLLAIMVIGIIMYANSSDNKKDDYTAYLDNYEELDRDNAVGLVEKNTFDRITYWGNWIYLIDNDGKDFKVEADTDLVVYFENTGHHVENISKDYYIYQGSGNSTQSSLIDGGIQLVISVILIVIMMIFLKKMMGNVLPNAGEKGSNTADSNCKIPDVKLSDVKGIDEIKDDVMNIIDCIKNYDTYMKSGARVPRGILLSGDPGTGKTLLAKAIANESGVKFLYASGSDFIEKYVGIGARRVRELYAEASKNTPCIVFIDEIDCVASNRQDANMESTQTINALLTQIDGFNSDKLIMTICATNRPDVLDSAFTRSGRFDVKLNVPMPDKEGRLEILKLYSKKKSIGDDVDLADWAARTTGFSGADLENLMNDAAINSVRDKTLIITNNNIEDAFFKLVLKGSKKRMSVDADTKGLLAWHECGHTIATRLLTNERVSTVTLIGSTSGAGAVTIRVVDDSILKTKKYLENVIKIFYAGRAAEELYRGNSDDITTGASNDIKQATSIIMQYISSYGMGRQGMLDMSQLSPVGYSNSMYNEAREISDRLYNEVFVLLEQNINMLRDMADRLVEVETMSSNEIDIIVEKYKVQEENKGEDFRG